MWHKKIEVILSAQRKCLRYSPSSIGLESQWSPDLSAGFLSKGLRAIKVLLYRSRSTASKSLNESNDLSVKNHLRTFSLIQNILTLATNYLHLQTTSTLTGKEENAVKMLDACHLLPRDQIFLVASLPCFQRYILLWRNSPHMFIISSLF